MATIQNDLLEATRNSAAAFVDQGKFEIDKAIKNLSNDIAQSLYGSGTGARGAITTISTGLITLTDPNSVVQFEVGMVLVAAATDGASPRAAAGYVIAVNRALGTVTVSASAGGSAGTPTSWAAADFLYSQGDLPSGGATTTAAYLKITGLAGWVPSAAPSAAENFWGVDRSVDTRLGGLRFDGTSESIEEALIDASALVAREGGSPKYFFTNFASWAALEKSLGSKVQYVEVRHESADIGFSALRVMTPYGPVNVIPDRSCPALKGWLLDLDSWKLRSLGKAPHILTYGDEGLQGLRVGTSDALEVRAGFYGNLVCNAPGHNCYVGLSA